MDDTRELDMYIFAYSQLNYRFDVRLPYSEPSGLFDGAAESVWDVRTWHNIATGTEEPVDNFGQMTIFAQPVEDDCCGYGHHYEHADDKVIQHAQSAKKRKPDTGGANAPAQATAAPLALGLNA